MNKRRVLKILKDFKRSKDVNPSNIFVHNSKIRILNIISVTEEAQNITLFKRITATTGAILMLLTTGLAATAQTTNPGDALYPLKNVTEKMIVNVEPLKTVTDEISEIIEETKPQENNSRAKNKNAAEDNNKEVEGISDSKDSKYTKDKGGKDRNDNKGSSKKEENKENQSVKDNYSQKEKSAKSAGEKDNDNKSENKKENEGPKDSSRDNSDNNKSTSGQSSEKDNK